MDRKWGAPFGKSETKNGVLNRLFPRKHLEILEKGMFGFQPNNDEHLNTLGFFAGRLSPGMRVLEVGGSLSGFQFALDRSGMHVVNVDPEWKARVGPFQLKA